MLWESLEGIWRHLAGFWEAFGCILEALGGSWVAFGGIWDPLGHPWGRAPGWLMVKRCFGGAIRGPNQQDTNQPDLLIPDQQLDRLPNTSWLRLDTGNRTGEQQICRLQAIPRSLVAPDKQGPADIYVYIYIYSMGSSGALWPYARM